jgi:hypothetical protein
VTFLSGRLDEYKIEQLRSWGVGLSKDANDEIRATGKAILLLIEEIDRLHVDLWNAKAIGPPEVEAEASDEVRSDEVRSEEVRSEEVRSEEVRSDGSLDSSLRARLRRIASRGPSRQAG